MPERTVVVASQVGLHARPAKVFSQAAASCGLPVRIGRPGSTGVDAASILGVMSLGVKHGEEVVVSVTGDGADAVLDELVGLLTTDLDTVSTA